MQNKDPKVPPPVPSEKKEEARATPPWGVQPYPAYPKPASPVMPGMPGMPAPPRPTRASTMQYGNAPEAPMIAPLKDVAGRLLSLVAGTKTAVQTDMKGSVLAVSGQGDAESLCAVAALTHGALAASEDVFGLGELQAWSISTNDITVFALRHEGKLLASSCEPTKNPESAMRRILASFAEER